MLRLKSMAVLVLVATVGRPNTPVPSTQLSLPPSTVIHPPMICRRGDCAEIKPGMPP